MNSPGTTADACGIAGIYSRQLTASVCPPAATLSAPMHRPVAISHTLIVRSLDPDHNNLES